MVTYNKRCNIIHSTSLRTSRNSIRRFWATRAVLPIQTPSLWLISISVSLLVDRQFARGGGGGVFNLSAPSCARHEHIRTLVRDIELHARKDKHALRHALFARLHASQTRRARAARSAGSGRRCGRRHARAASADSQDSRRRQLSRAPLTAAASRVTNLAVPCIDKRGRPAQRK